MKSAVPEAQVVSGVKSIRRPASMAGCQVEPELALGGRHAGEAGEFLAALELEQRLAVGVRREVVEDLDAARRLLEREMAHVRDQDDQLFLVIRAAERLGGGFDDDDAGLSRGLLGQRAGPVGEAIVGDVDPAAVPEVFAGRVGRFDPRLEDSHGSL